MKVAQIVESLARVMLKVGQKVRHPDGTESRWEVPDFWTVPVSFHGYCLTFRGLSTHPYVDVGKDDRSDGSVALEKVMKEVGRYVLAQVKPTSEWGEGPQFEVLREWDKMVI